MRKISLLFLAALVCVALSAGCPSLKPDGDDDKRPLAAFKNDLRIGEPGMTVIFTDMSQPRKSPIVSWEWRFGDGAISDEVNPAHTYTTAGQYNVILEVTAKDGRAASYVKRNEIVVLPTERTVGAFTGEIRQFAGMDFVWVDPGSFVMGNSSTVYLQADAEPEHPVTITRGFWMGRTEVSASQWQDIMGDNPTFFADPNITGMNHPVEQASWNDCQDFIDVLNQTGSGIFRLPTEAEWEYACRAGTRTDFYFGDDPAGIINNGWVYTNSRLITHQCGLLAPNAWGFQDMLGNVAEWTQDLYTTTFTSGDPVTDPIGGAGGAFRVSRGGSWRHDTRLATSSSRFPYLPHSEYNFIGVRLVMQ